MKKSVKKKKDLISRNYWVVNPTKIKKKNISSFIPLLHSRLFRPFNNSDSRFDVIASLWRHPDLLRITKFDGLDLVKLTIFKFTTVNRSLYVPILLLINDSFIYLWLIFMTHLSFSEFLEQNVRKRRPQWYQRKCRRDIFVSLFTLSWSWP